MNVTGEYELTDWIMLQWMIILLCSKPIIKAFQKETKNNQRKFANCHFNELEKMRIIIQSVRSYSSTTFNSAQSINFGCHHLCAFVMEFDRYDVPMYCRPCNRKNKPQGEMCIGWCAGTTVAHISGSFFCLILHLANTARKAKDKNYLKIELF